MTNQTEHCRLANKVQQYEGSQEECHRSISAQIQPKNTTSVLGKAATPERLPQKPLPHLYTPLPPLKHIFL